LKKDPQEFRTKQLFAFQPYNATRLQVTRGDQTMLFERIEGGGPDGGAWREVSLSPREMDSSKVQTAVSRLSILRAVSFADPKPANLSSPTLVVHVTYSVDVDKPQEEQVTFSMAATQPRAMRSDWPDAAVLDPNAYKMLIEALDALRQ